MAHVPRMAHEGWPGWAKAFFVLGALALLACGILSVILAKAIGSTVMGIIAIVVAALYLYGLFIRPNWLKDPS